MLVAPGPLDGKYTRSPSRDQHVGTPCPARMSVMTPSPTARSRLAVMHRGVPPVAGTTHNRSSKPASSPLSALYAMTSPRGDQIGDTTSYPVAIFSRLPLKSTVYTCDSRCRSRSSSALPTTTSRVPSADQSKPPTSHAPLVSCVACPPSADTT